MLASMKVRYGSAALWGPVDTLAGFEIGPGDGLAGFGDRRGSYLATVSRDDPVSRAMRR